MILQIIYVLWCFYIIQELWKRCYKNAASSPPYLSGGIPLIGHALKLIGDRKHAFNTVKWISEEILANGGIMSLNMGPRILYVISNPDDCNKIANECLEKDYFYSFAKPLLGNGLTIAEVPLWKQHRRFMNPIFWQQNLNGFLYVFNLQARRLVKQFKPELGKGAFDHQESIQINGLESICMTSFGADVDQFGGIHKQYLEGLEDILDIITERFQKIWLHSDFLYNLSSLKKREVISVAKIRRFTDAILAKRKAEMENNKTNTDRSGQYTPFMSYLLESSEVSCYSEEDIIHESNTLVAAGYDTSTRTSTIIMMLLGSHQDVQKKVYEEMLEVFGDSDRDVTKEDLPKLVYLDAVIKESMRLYPIGPMIARYIVKDIQLKNYTLKAGNGVGIMIWAMHRHSMWGPDVELFRPERWLDSSLPRNPNGFGPFSLGKRSCIGKHYAMMSIKTTLVHILRSYRISSDISKLELEIDATLRPSSGQHISIEERNPISVY